PSLAPSISVFFTAPASTAISTLSLHDALPISRHDSCARRRRRPPGHRPAAPRRRRRDLERAASHLRPRRRRDRRGHRHHAPGLRSEEHTSELQSRENLVCRLLLEKKKTNYTLN